MSYQSGGAYEGEWRDGKRHGHGTLTHPSGFTYTGMWSSDRCAPCGAVMMSSHVHARPHGTARLQLPCGVPSNSDWQDGTCLVTHQSQQRSHALYSDLDTFSANRMGGRQVTAASQYHATTPSLQPLVPPAFTPHVPLSRSTTSLGRPTSRTGQTREAPRPITSAQASRVLEHMELQRTQQLGHVSSTKHIPSRPITPKRTLPPLTAHKTLAFMA